MILSLLACIDARAPVAMPVRFEGGSPDLQLEAGAIHLDRAELEVADLRMESAPVARWLPSLVGTATAHPGHEFAGSVRGELLGSWTLDLVGPPTDLGTAEGWEGDVATASFDAGTLVLAGTWTGPEGSVPFDLEVEVDRPIVGVESLFSLDADEPPSLSLSAHVDHALGFVEWAETDGDGIVTAADGTLRNTALFGITSSTSWTLAQESP